MIPALSFRNCSIADVKFGELFLAEDGEKFIIGLAGNGKLVAVMLEGDSGKHGPYYFSLIENWNRHGVAVEPEIVVDPASLRNPGAVHPGSISLDRGTIHIVGFSGQTHQPVAIDGKGESPAQDAVAFGKWAATVEGPDGKPVELFVFGAE